MQILLESPSNQLGSIVKNPKSQILFHQQTKTATRNSHYGCSSTRIFLHSPSVDNDIVIKINGKNSIPKQTEELTSKNGEPEAASANKMWRDSSYDFSNDNSNKDFDFTTDSSPASQRSPGLSKIVESPNYDQVSPREVKVSFNENLRRRSSGSGREGGGGAGDGEEVVTCSSNKSFCRESSLMRTKTKSRLLDPPEQDGRSQRMVKSGILGKQSEIDDDDPFLEEDLPEEFKKMKFSKWSVL